MILWSTAIVGHIMRKRTEKHLSKSRANYAKKAGRAPGSIVHLGEVKMSRPDITLFDYGREKLTEVTFDSIEESRAHTGSGPCLWLNVHGLHDTRVMEEIGARFQLHPLVLEDIANTQQRPKLDEYENYEFVALRTFHYDITTHNAVSDQISLVLGKDFLLSFQERPTGLFEPVRNRLRQTDSGLRHAGSGALLHALIDAVVDQYFVTVEALSSDIETLEERLLTGSAQRPIEEINHFRREVQEIRRSIWPLREVLANLLRLPAHRLPTETQLYFRDVYDHTVHVTEHLDTLRDVIGSLFELHQANVNNRMNGEIRMLTVVTTAFAPATLLTGFFGMNFTHMPWLDQAWGWKATLGLMTGCGLLLISALFWRRWWLKENA